MRAYVAALAAAIAAAGVACGPQPPYPPSPSPSAPAAHLAASEAWQPTAASSPSATAPPTPEATYRNDPSEFVFLLPPTWQWAGSDSALIAFELDRSAEARAFCQPADQSGAWTVITPSVHGTALTLMVDGLLPATEYRCAVGASVAPEGPFGDPAYAGQVWNPIYLRTLAAVPRSLRIAAIGDSGFADPVTAEMAATMASLAPDLFLHLGDVVYRAEEDGDVYRAYERKYFAAFSPVLHRGPVYAVLGNHDLDAPVRLAEEPFFFHVFPPFPDACCPGVASGGGRLWYSIALGDVQLLLLNSQSFYGLGDLEEQTRWLQDRLSDRAVRVRVPVMHIAPYSGGLHVSDGVRIQSSWHPLFRQAGVPLVLSGHDHNYQHLEQDQVHYVVSGGGSQALYSRTLNLPGSLAFLAEPHFLIIEIDPDTIRVRVVDPAGIDRDAFEIPLLP